MIGLLSSANRWLDSIEHTIEKQTIRRSQIGTSEDDLDSLGGRVADPWLARLR